MYSLLRRIMTPLLVAIIVIFGGMWVAGPSVIAPNTEASARIILGAASVPGRNLANDLDQTVTAEPTPTDEVFPTDAPFPTDEPFPDTTPTDDVWPTDPPFPPEEPYPYPIPTDDPAIPTEIGFPTDEPYPFPTDDPYPYPFPTDDPYPYPFPPEETAIPTPSATRIVEPYPEPLPTATETPTNAPTAAPSTAPVDTPTPTEKRQREPESAVISVVQRPQPNRVARRSAIDFGLLADAPPSVVDDGIVDYVVLVTNHGAGRAQDVIVTMPFDPAALLILDATFSTNAAHVSRIISDTATPALQFQTGPLAANDTITATVRMLVRPSAPDGADLGPRLSFTWIDQRSGGTGRSNEPLLVVGDADISEVHYPLAVMGATNASRVITGTIFAPGEPVALWYNGPGGEATAIASVQADAAGSIAASLNTGTLVPGAYTVVAEGAWSKFTAVASFTVEP